MEILRSRCCEISQVKELQCLLSLNEFLTLLLVLREESFLQPPSVNNDGANQRLRDFHIESEFSLFLEFVCVSGRSPGRGQRDVEHAPVPYHKVQFFILGQQCDAKPERAEAFAQQVF